MKQLLITIASLVLVGCGDPPKDIWEAARNGSIEAVEQFLATGVDVNAKDEYGQTPLHFASNREIAGLLIAAGADVNHGHQWFPLYIAGVAAQVALLFQAC